MIISISGPSASGKTTVARTLLEAYPESRMIESTTTRARRPSDVPGEYRYVSHEEFENLSKSGAFLWDVAVHGNRYGTIKAAVEAALKLPLSIAILTIPAAERLAEYLQERGTSTLLTPLYLEIANEEVLRERLMRRGDSDADVALRIEECRTWSEQAALSPVQFVHLDAAEPRDMLIEKAKGAVARALREATPRV